MRIIDWETAFWIALKNCYEELGRKVSIHVILVKGEYMQSSTFFLQKISATTNHMKVTASHKEHTLTMKAFLDMNRCKNWAHKIVS